MIRVLILTEGGGGVGYGHITRCSAVAIELQLRGNQVEVFVAGPETSLAFFPDVPKACVDWTNNIAICRSSLTGRDIVLFDSYKADEHFLASVLEGFSGLPAVFDDLGRIPFAQGIVINGAPHAENLYLHRLTTSIRALLGPSWQPLRPAFQNCGSRVLSEVPTNILVTLGGDDIHSLAPSLFERLSRASEKWQVTFITTSVSRTRKDLLDLVHPPHRVLVDLGAAAMCHELTKADIALISAGQTTFETACTGLPVVLIQIADNQQSLIEAWLKLGYVITVFNPEAVRTPGLVEDSLRHLISFPLRETVSRIGRQTVDGQGARRIAEKFEELCND